MSSEVSPRTHKAPRIVWDGEKLVAAANITIEEIDGVVARLSKLGRTLRQQQGAKLFTPPAPKLLKP